jgi:hypothetical protein
MNVKMQIALATQKVSLVEAALGLAACLAAFSFCSCDDSCDLPPYPTPAQTEAERWHQDLDFLERALPKCHKNPFTKISEEAFHQAVSHLHISLDQLPRSAVILGFAEVVAMLGDAHTALSIDGPAVGFRMYPLQLSWFKEGLFVTDVAKERQEFARRRVIAINNTPVDQALESVTKLIPHENRMWALALSPRYLATSEVLWSLGILADLGQGRYTLKDDQGATAELVLSPLEFGKQPSWALSELAQPKPLYLQQVKRNYWHIYIEDSKAIYVQYNRCRNDAEITFDTFASEVLAESDNHPVERFILDLRLNIGGNSDLFAPLLEGIKARPALNQAGHLFVIIGRQTFSSGVYNAIQMKQQTNAVLFGEPTGGKPNSFGEVKHFLLPNSQLPVSYSTKYFQLYDGDPDSLLPDLQVETGAKDFFSGTDPVLEAIFNYGK